MNADPLAQFEAIAQARGSGQRRHSARGTTVRITCSGHDDRHASCDMTLTPGGRLLFYCHSQHCSFDQIAGGLRADGLWSSEHQPSRPMRDPFPASAFHEPTAAPCCFERQSRCEHWLEFDRLWLLGELHKNLVEACRELVEKLERADQTIIAEKLRQGIEFAIPFGAIAVPGVDGEAFEHAIDLAIAEFTQNKRAA